MVNLADTESDDTGDSAISVIAGSQEAVDVNDNSDGAALVRLA